MWVKAAFEAEKLLSKDIEIIVIARTPTLTQSIPNPNPNPNPNSNPNSTGGGAGRDGPALERGLGAGSAPGRLRSAT